ncbi:MAG: hypothetical protein K2X66_18655, partial [Cyanobacteria bacterium]|nr:hypothetical protein [Cyanobacteriota bacterium]
LPLFFKSVLGHPKLKKQLIKEEFPLTFKLVGWLLSPVLYPLQKIPFLKSAFDQIEDLLRPTSFHKKLERRLDEAIQTLPKDQQEHLKHAGVLPLLVESMAEKLYLTLLTGQEKSDTTLAENGFYKTVPQAIVHSDPETAKDLLIPFLKSRLKTLSKEQLAAWTQEKLTGLNPEMVSLASALLNKREFGLNWRIDAAKDVADFDRVLESKTPEEKIRRFEEEIEFVKTFWTKMTQKVKQIFEKSMTIAELTDFELLSNGEVAKKSFEKLFDANVFTSTPNMSYMYNTPTQLVHYAPRPDEFGNSQMKPSQFLTALKSMSQSVPFPALRMYQNLTSSHDYPNTSHALLINPAIATMDLLKWWGVKDDLKEVSTELTTKPGFSDERDLLSHHGINDLGFVLERLNQAVQSPTFQSRLSPEVYEYFSENQKQKSKDGGQTIEWLGATPTPIKLRFLDEAFRFIKPEELGVSDEVAHQVLKNVLKERIAEPSEARAMRAVISNTLLNLDWLAVAKRAGFPEERAPYLKQTLSPLMHQGIKGAIKTYGRHWGYQPLEIAMDNAFKSFPANWQDAYPGAGEKIQSALRDQIYQQAMTPVLDKLHRIITLQVAVPGNPSIYLPDLFGQTGSELVKNMFVQNRHLIRYDYLDKDSDKPYLHHFFDQVQEVIQLRKKYPVLNDGIVLEPKITPHLDDDGVVPIIRDNGVDQVIMLVNTGKPNSIGWDKIGEGPSYKEIKLDPNLKEIYNYTLDLSTLALTPGETRYVDPENGEAFMLDSKSRLVKVNNPQEGIDIRRPYRMLVRQN